MPYVGLTISIVQDFESLYSISTSINSCLTILHSYYLSMYYSVLDFHLIVTYFSPCTVSFNSQVQQAFFSPAYAGDLVTEKQD